MVLMPGRGESVLCLDRRIVLPTIMPLGKPGTIHFMTVCVLKGSLFGWSNTEAGSGYR